MRTALSRHRSLIGLALAVPVASLLFTGVARTQSPPGNPDLPVTTPSHATAPGVFAEVNLGDIPTTARPAETIPRGAHIHREFVQHEGGASRPVQPKTTSFPPEAPPQMASPPSGPGSSVVQWNGLSDTGSGPADVTLGLSESQVIEAVDSGFAVYSRFGTEIRGYTSFQSFLNTPPGWQGFMFAPRIVPDFYGRHTVVMLVLGRDDVNARSYFWLAMPASAYFPDDLTGRWWVWRFDATETTGDSPAWLDDAGVSNDSSGVYVTGDYFYFSGGFRGSSLWSINPDIYYNGATNGWQFVDLQWPSGEQAFALQPAMPRTADPRTFFVNTFSGSGHDVVLWKMTGDRANAPTLTQAVIGIAPYQAVGMHVDQPGSDVDVDAGDARVTNAMYQWGTSPGDTGEYVYFVLTDDVNGDQTSSGWLTVQLDINGNTNVWQDLLWGGPGYYYFDPAFTTAFQIAQHPNLAVFGNWASPESAGNQFVSGLFKIYANQPAGTSGPLISHAAGAGPYVALDGEGRNRWSGYSGAAAFDRCYYAWGAVPTADTDNRWRTAINAVHPGSEPTCPDIAVTRPNGGDVWNEGTTQTITWLSRGLTETNRIFLLLNQGYNQVSLQPAGLPIESTSFDWSVPGLPGMPGRGTISVESFSGTAGGTAEALGTSPLFTITAPDLQVVNPSVTQAAPAPGAIFTASATVVNQGDGSSNVPTTIRFYVSTDAIITTADTELAAASIDVLGGGSAAEASAPITAPAAPEDYWIGACVDVVPGDWNPVNQCSPGVPIRVGLFPDLVVTAIGAPATATLGQVVTVSNSVTNRGTSSTSRFRVGIYYSADAVCDSSDVLIGSRLVDALDAGLTSAAATSATIPSPVAGDSGYLCVVADDLGEVAEPREGNNTASAAVTFIISDLTVSAITAPSTAAPGQRIAVSNSVANLGPLRTPHGFWVGIYYSADANCDTRDVQIGSRFVAGLDAGLSSADETTVYIPPDAATGTRFVCAVADTGGQVPETDENNNTASTAITVALPTVNLKVNGQDAVLPAAVSSNGPVRLTVDMTAGGKPLDHYLGIYVGGTLFWVTWRGLSTTPAPLARFTPAATTNSGVFDVPRWPPGPALFLWLMVDGSTVVGQDVIRVNVSP